MANLLLVPPAVTTVLRAFACAALVAALAAACSDGADSPTSPTTTPARTIAEASNTEWFEDSVPVGGSAFYSFTLQQYGTVNITLVSIGGPFVPSSVMMGLGIGVPSGTDCGSTTTVNTAPGATAQVTGIYEPGVYCAKVWDIGNLFGPARFSISIAHP